MVRGAVLYNFNEALTVDSLELKAPRADEVVVKLAASGVCHSDLSVQQMKLPFPPPVVLGHEGAGIVEEVGKDVATLKPGDHVVLSWVEACGRCHYCVAGTVQRWSTRVRFTLDRRFRPGLYPGPHPNAGGSRWYEAQCCTTSTKLSASIRWS